MSFTIARFAEVRPYLFHLTARENLELIRELRTLYPASEILRQSKRSELLESKRPTHVEVRFKGAALRIRDQKPLHNGNMVLGEGWTFAQFIRHLNDRVFFWPGMRDGFPISYGQRHFERYATENPVLLRVRTQDILNGNEGLAPKFCKYNSGSPRYTYGNPSPRGPATFCSSDEASFGAASVVEVTFPGAVSLPELVEIATSPSGPWVKL